MSQNQKQIKVRCEECGREEVAAEYCPYTGYRYNTGWVTVCECKGTMKEVNNEARIRETKESNGNALSEAYD